MSLSNADILSHIESGQHASIDQSHHIFSEIMKGNLSHDDIKKLLLALKAKGETTDEIIGAVNAIREAATPFPISETIQPSIVDTCGTGGDGHHTLNVSTAVCFVLAACGVPVAKHGNKAVSSKSGSADVLTALGVNIQASVETMATSLETIGICFLMAPLYHPAMKHVAPVRKELGTRTIFNILGPLLNPAHTSKQLIGVYDTSLLDTYAAVLPSIGVENAWVVHAENGMDELSISGPTNIVQIKGGVKKKITLSPSDAGLSESPIEEIVGGDAQHNAAALVQLLEGHKGAYRDIALLNTAAALVIAGKASSLNEGVSLAANAIDEGKALQILESFKQVTNA